MTAYGRKLEKEYRDGMIINAIYDFIGTGTGGWKRGYRLAAFIGADVDLQLVFEDPNGDAYHIYACEMGGFSLISKPKKPAEDSFFFDKETFLKYTNDRMFFKIKLASLVYDCLIMLDSSGDDYLHFAYADTKGINSGTMCLTAYGLCYTKEDDGEFKCVWYPDQFEIMTYFDSKIPLSDLFKKKEEPSKPIEEKKEETVINNFDEFADMFEKKWRERMIVGQKYDIIRKGENDQILMLTFLHSHGHGSDFTLTFEHDNHEQLNIKACDITWVYPLSFPAALPKPMQLVKKIEEYKFDEKAFYRATNGVRHFLIINSYDDIIKCYEAFYYGPTPDNAGMHIAFAGKVGFNNTTVQSTELYHDKITCDPVWTNFKLLNGDSRCTLDEIKIDDIFKKEEKLEWDLHRMKIGKAYLIRIPETGNETYGIYRFLHEPATPDQSSIVFTAVSDKGKVDTYVSREELVSGKIEIYELAVKKGYDE